MKRLLALLPAGALLAVAACGSDDPVSIEGAWARATAAGQTRGAIYFDLTVADDDTLLGAGVPESVAADTQVHGVVMADGEMSDHDMGDDEMADHDMGDEMTAMDDGEHEAGSGDMDEMTEMSGDTADMNAAMVMREVAGGLALTGGETVPFEPGGYHVMLLDLVDPLEVGEEIELTLDFAEAGDTTIIVEVAESAP